MIKVSFIEYVCVKYDEGVVLCEHIFCNKIDNRKSNPHLFGLLIDNDNLVFNNPFFMRLIKSIETVKPTDL